MIYTLTLNPAIDASAHISVPFARGGLNRINKIRRDPGGKGINVSPALLQTKSDNDCDERPFPSM